MLILLVVKNYPDDLRSAETDKAVLTTKIEALEGLCTAFYWVLICVKFCCFVLVFLLSVFVSSNF